MEPGTASHRVRGFELNNDVILVPLGCSFTDGSSIQLKFTTVGLNTAYAVLPCRLFKKSGDASQTVARARA